MEGGARRASGQIVESGRAVVNKVVIRLQGCDDHTDIAVQPSTEIELMLYKYLAEKSKIASTNH